MSDQPTALPSKKARPTHLVMPGKFDEVLRKYRPELSQLTRDEQFDALRRRGAKGASRWFYKVIRGGVRISARDLVDLAKAIGGRLDELCELTDSSQIYDLNGDTPAEQAVTRVISNVVSKDASARVEKRQLSGTRLGNAVVKALAMISADRFASPTDGMSRGGWSRCYASTFIPFAFPHRKPQMLSQSDSVTLTHLMVRGLRALQAFDCEIGCLQPSAREEVDGLIEDAYCYLHNHYRDGRGGMYRCFSQEDKFVPDIRHSATLARGLLEFGEADRELVRTLLESVVVDALDKTKYDNRVPTHAEVLRCIHLLDTPDFRSPSLKGRLLGKARRIHESSLCRLFKSAASSRRDSHSHLPVGFFVDPSAGKHMSPYYSWWVLDACGSFLRQSKCRTSRTACVGTMQGLCGLRVSTETGATGFPVAFGREPDAGATAQIALSLCETDEEYCADCGPSSIRFIIDSLLEAGSSAVQFPFMLWAFFPLLRRCEPWIISKEWLSSLDASNRASLRRDQ